jgi:hypothetical protein
MLLQKQYGNENFNVSRHLQFLSILLFFSNITINPLKPKLVKTVFKNSVRTSKRTPHFTITKINWLTLFKEIIPLKPKLV